MIANLKTLFYMCLSVANVMGVFHSYDFVISNTYNCLCIAYDLLDSQICFSNSLYILCLNSLQFICMKPFYMIS